MSKYEFDLSVGIQEVLDADSAAKVESQVMEQKKKLEEPINLTLSIGDAKKRFQELEREAKKVQKSLDKALSVKNFDGISQYTKQMSNIQKEQQELLSIIGEQTKAITGQSSAVKTVEAAEKRRKQTVDNITTATEDTVAAIKEQAEAINQVAKAEAKLQKTRKSKTSTTKDTTTVQDVTRTAEQVGQENVLVDKTKLESKVKKLKSLISNQEAWIEYLDKSLNKENFKTSGKREATNQLKTLTQSLMSHRRENYEYYVGEDAKEMVEVAWMHGYQEAKRQGVAQSTLDRHHVPDAEFYYDVNLAKLQKEYDYRQKVFNESTAELRAIEAQIAAQEQVTTAVEKTAEARNKEATATENVAAAQKKLKEVQTLIGDLTGKYGKETFNNIFGETIASLGKLDASNAVAFYDALIAKNQEYQAQLELEKQKQAAAQEQFKLFYEQSGELSSTLNKSEQGAIEYANAIEKITNGAWTATEAIEHLNKVVGTLQGKTQAQEVQKANVVEDLNLGFGYGLSQLGKVLGEVDLDGFFKQFNIADDQIGGLKQKFIEAFKASNDFLQGITQKDLTGNFLDELTDDIMRLGSQLVEVEKQYEGFREYMKGNKLYYDDSVKAEIGGTYEWSKFYKSHQKYLTKSKEQGSFVDTYMDELVELFPHLFSQDILETGYIEQFYKVMDVWDKARADMRRPLVQEIPLSEEAYGVDREAVSQAVDGLYVDILNKSFLLEEKLADATKATLEGKQKQAQITEQVVQRTEAQIDAEKKVAEAANETANALKSANDISAEELIDRDINEALAQLRSAKNNETTLFTLKGVFEGEDLVNQAQAMVENIAEQANLSLGKFNVKDDIVKVQLYNKELQVTVDQMYKLRAATEETGTAQLELMSQSFSQNVKALNENNFDVEGVQQRALASIEKVRSSLHGLSYDLTDLENAAKNISSQDDFNKFNNQLKAAQDNIQAIKNSTVSKSSMNPLANMQRDMQNANIEIETMRLKLEKFGDVDGVAKATQMLNDMTKAAQEFNNAQDAQGQQAAYNNYSNIRSSFNAQMEYINVAKQLSASQQEAQKIATEAYKYQFQNQYKYTGGKTAADQNVLDSMSDYYKKEEQEAQQFSNNIKGIYDQLMSTLKQMGTVDTKMGQLVMQDKGSGLYSTVLSGLQTEKSVLVSDIRSLESELQSVLNLPQGTSGLGAIFTDARVQTALTKDEIQKLDDALKNLENIQFNFAAKLSQQIQPVVEKVQSLKQMIADGFISQDSDIAKNILNIDSTIASKNKNYKETGSTAAAQDLIQYTNSVNEYVSALDKAAQAERQYFAGKQQYTAGTGQTFENVNNTASSTAKSYNDLTEAVRNYTKEYQLGEPYITKFTQSANGISKIEFSTFEKGTGAVRKFNIEMGNISQKMYATETTVSKSIANIQAAFNQIDKINTLKDKLSASGIDFSGSSASTQVQELFSKYQALSKELANGDKADQTTITKLTQDCKLATAEVEKLYKKMIQTDSAIANDQVLGLGKGNLNDDVYGQLTRSAQRLIGDARGVTLEFSNWNAATKTVNASLVNTNGTVETFKVSMDGLSGQMTAQQTGVNKLTSSWDRFKTSIGRAGKQLMIALVGYNAFFKVVSEVRKGIGYVKEIDLALTELKKVTDETEESYRNFLNTAASTAGEIGSTVSDFTEASANFARLGYTMEESAEMAKTAIVYKNVADGLDTVDEATDSIISTMKAFGIESNDTMGIIDRFNEVGNNFAITSAGIGEALQRSASALYAGGNTIDESIALVTAANSVIQNPEQVGELLADYKVA